MRKVRCSRLQHNLPFILCHLWTMLCPLWMDHPLWYLRRPSIPLWNSGSIYVGGCRGHLDQISSTALSTPQVMSQPPLVPTTAPGSALWAAPSSAVTGGSMGWAHLLSCPLFFPSAHGLLDPLEGGRKDREDSRRYGKKSGQLANRGSRFPRLSVSTVPCSLGRISLPWPALMSQLENEGIALTDVSRPSLPENCNPVTGLPSLAPVV